MGNRDTQLRQIQADLERLAQGLKEELGLEALVLTGSWARGDALVESDVDIAVVCTGFGGMNVFQRIEAVWNHWQGEGFLQPACYLPEEVAKCWGVYLWDALADGKVIHDSGIWAKTKARFDHLLATGALKRVKSGWKFDPNLRDEEPGGPLG